MPALRADLTAWRASWSKLRTPGTFGHDLPAALTVAAVALPFNLALAVACELPPAVGLVAGAVGGVVAAAFGGSPLQVTGPAAALATMVLGVNREFGAGGVAAATVLVGLTQLAVYGLRVGKYLARLPEAVLAGFTSGVGLTILDQQIPELLGFDYRVIDFVRMVHMPAVHRAVSWRAALCGALVAGAVLAFQRKKRIPGAIFGIVAATLLAGHFDWPVERIGVIPNRFPAPTVPLVARERWFELAAAAVPLGLLAAMESLLSAKAVDRMAGTRHRSDLEVFGQGCANLATGFVGGMPVSGVLVRSGINAQSGATSRLSALLHGVLLAAAMVAFGGPLSNVPYAALAGLLCIVGGRLVEVREFLHLVFHRPLAALAFALTAAGTVGGHLLAGLCAGLVAALIDAFRVERNRIA